MQRQHPSKAHDNSGNIIGTSLDNATVKYNQTLGIKRIGDKIPDKYQLLQNYPNPFNSNTQIEFHLPENTNVKLVIYDILGREVAALLDEFLKAGKYSIDWVTSSEASGTYFYRLNANDFTETKRMILVK